MSEQPRDKGLAELDRQEASGSPGPLHPKDRVRVTFESNYEDVEIATWHNTPLMSIATVEVLERADDPNCSEIGTVRREDYDDGYSSWQCVAHPTDPGETLWFCTYSTAPGNIGKYLGHSSMRGIPVIGAAVGTPAAEAEKPADDLAQIPGPRCNAIEGATGINCRLPRLHGVDVDHEGSHEPAGKQDSVGYRLFVRWPWNEWDRDATAVGFEMPLPDWEREILEQEDARQRDPRVFQSDGPEPPADVVLLTDGTGSIPYLKRFGDHWRWTKALNAPEHPAYRGGSWEYVTGEMDRPCALTEVI